MSEDIVKVAGQCAPGSCPGIFTTPRGTFLVRGRVVEGVSAVVSDVSGVEVDNVFPGGFVGVVDTPVVESSVDTPVVERSVGVSVSDVPVVPVDVPVVPVDVPVVPVDVPVVPVDVPVVPVDVPVVGVNDVQDGVTSEVPGAPVREAVVEVPREVFVEFVSWYWRRVVQPA